MIHLGDITQIKGNEVPVVDCVIGGSPCQGLSQAGKRAGLDDVRSGLYIEQIRVIKEMRENDRANGRTGVDIRPRYMVWENVPRAFSTNNGLDFAAVLEEAIRVAEPKAPSIPVPEKGWPTAGCIVGDQWSVAWRVLDAQFWGTSDKPLPQRRRRIALVADFGGLSASEILFVRKSVSGNIEPGEPKRKEAPRDVGESSVGTGKPVIAVDQGGGKSRVHNYEGVSPTLTCTNDGAPAVTYCIEGNGSRPSHKGDGFTKSDTMYTLNATEHHAVAYSLEPGIAAREGGHIYDGVSGTLRAKAGDNQMAVAYTYDARGNGDGHMVNTLTGDHQNRVTDYTAVVVEPVGEYWDGSQVAGTLTANNAGGGQRMPDKENFNCVVQKVDEPIAIDRAFFNQGKNAQYAPQVYEDGTVSTLVSKGPSAVAVRHIVRRLTPGECELLQGFPKGWTDIGEWIDSKGKKHKEADSPRYKALGNSIALPPWKWVLKRLCSCYERDATMASLFDGIGGFPLIWEQINGKGSCLWASEIEEFPMAVTRLRFGGNDNG